MFDYLMVRKSDVCLVKDVHVKIVSLSIELLLVD